MAESKMFTSKCLKEFLIHLQRFLQGTVVIKTPFLKNIKNSLKSAIFVERRHQAMYLGPKDTMKTYFLNSEAKNGLEAEFSL